MFSVVLGRRLSCNSSYLLFSNHLILHFLEQSSRSHGTTNNFICFALSSFFPKVFLVHRRKTKTLRQCAFDHKEDQRSEEDRGSKSLRNPENRLNVIIFLSPIRDNGTDR